MMLRALRVLKSVVYNIFIIVGNEIIIIIYYYLMLSAGPDTRAHTRRITSTPGARLPTLRVLREYNQNKKNVSPRYDI